MAINVHLPKKFGDLVYWMYICLHDMMIELNKRKMYKIIRERESGKTTELIKRSARTNATLVVYSEKMVEYTVEYAKDMGLKIPTPVTYYDYLFNTHAFTRLEISNVLIDDADEFLQFHASNIGDNNVTVDAISITDNSETDQERIHQAFEDIKQGLRELKIIIEQSL